MLSGRKIIRVFDFSVGTLYRPSKGFAGYGFASGQSLNAHAPFVAGAFAACKRIVYIVAGLVVDFHFVIFDLYIF